MVVDEHADAPEADLLCFYGLVLLDWHRGRLSSPPSRDPDPASAA
ncbi:hypothetical protein [Streptomyces longisporoflavus]|nr:hypothetical protein [Streptomyces longisporoflavus]